MAKVARGDPLAQRELAVRLMGRLRRVARSLLRQSDQVDDAVQLAFLEMMKSAPTYRSESPLESWADRIAARAAIRLLHERKRYSDDDAESELERARGPLHL